MSDHRSICIKFIFAGVGTHVKRNQTFFNFFKRPDFAVGLSAVTAVNTFFVGMRVIVQRFHGHATALTFDHAAILHASM